MNVGGDGEYQVRIPVPEKLWKVLVKHGVDRERDNSKLYFKFNTAQGAIAFRSDVERAGFTDEHQVWVPVPEKLWNLMVKHDVADEHTNSKLYFYFKTKRRALAFVRDVKRAGYYAEYNE